MDVGCCIRKPRDKEEESRRRRRRRRGKEKEKKKKKRKERKEKSEKFLPRTRAFDGAMAGLGNRIRNTCEKLIKRRVTK